MRVSVYKMQTDDATKALLPCNGDKRGRGDVVCNMGIFAKNAVEAFGEGYSALILASLGGGGQRRLVANLLSNLYLAIYKFFKQNDIRCLRMPSFVFYAFQILHFKYSSGG